MTQPASAFYDRSLPKWPQMCISGTAIDPERALNIVFRTDEFFTSFSEYREGNNSDFHASWDRATGIGDIKARMETEFGDHSNPAYEHAIGDRFRALDAIEQSLRQHIGFVSLDYFSNEWGSSSFIFGAHGWINPHTGAITNNHNIGKWPSIEEVHRELERLLMSFLTSSSMDRCMIARAAMRMPET